MKEPSIPYNLLAKYFAGQCSPFENKEVEQWCHANEEQERLFLKLQDHWRFIHRDRSGDIIPDKELIREKIRRKIRLNADSLPPYSRSYSLRIAGIAAAIALAIGLSISFLIRDNTPKLAVEQFRNTIMAPPGQKSQLILPDGTNVWLNSGSVLTYSYEFNTRERTVELEGEGYFEVKHDQKLPFIVKTGSVHVKVHGTDFNVQAYPEDENILVSLIRGSVSLSRSWDESLITWLEPDQSAIISKADLAYQVIKCEAETDASWHLNELKFEYTTIEETWKKLERWYGVKVTLENVNPDNRYRFIVKTESLTELLAMIHILTPIEYELNGEEVAIRYK